MRQSDAARRLRSFGGLGLAVALAAVAAGGAAAHERVEIGEVAEGPVYYNRPGASLAAHEAAPRRWLKNVVWTRLPTEQEIWGIYPPLAVAGRESGGAMLRCRIEADGALQQCAAQPWRGRPELRFDQGALALAPFLRVAPTNALGEPTAGAYVAVPIAFDYPLTPFEAEAKGVPDRSVAPTVLTLPYVDDPAPAARPAQVPAPPPAPRAKMAATPAQALLSGLLPPVSAAAPARPMQTLQGQGRLTRGDQTRTCAGREARIFPATAETDAFFNALLTGRERGMIRTTEWAPQAFDDRARATLCDSSGAFAFQALPEGRYYVTAVVSWEVPSANGAYLEQTGGTIMTRVTLSGEGVKSVLVTP